MDPEANVFSNNLESTVLAQPEPAKMKESGQNHSEVDDIDLRDWQTKAVILSRESISGPPPPVPRKDTRPNTTVYELPAEQVGDWMQNRSQQLDDKEHEESQQLRYILNNMMESQNSSTGEIQILFTPSPVSSRSADKTLSDTMTTVHPLAMSPPSPLISLPQAPRRPARPSSLRLSSFARKKDLTTSRILVFNPDKPETAGSYQTQPHTGYNGSNRTKYGRGRHAATELIPQPSDDPQDPLNWQSWRKELNLYSLLVMVALCNVMKTALVSVNYVLTEQLSVSYVAVSALTGVPLMLSAFTGLASCTASKVWGRRPVYLVSAVLIFIGVVWNAKVSTSYAQFMTARIFQGLGWGAFDTMLVGSIMDTYFEHERSRKTAIYRIVSVATTWGPPIIGGVTSQNALGPRLQFEILAIFHVLSIPLLVLGAPESMYERSKSLLEKPTPGWTPNSGWSSLGLKSSSRFQRLPAWARGRGFNIDRAIHYVKEVGPPKSYSSPPGSVVDLALLLQTPCALIAPTTILVFVASFLPFSLLWGFASSLSGLFARDPFDLFPATVGSLLATPFTMSTAAVAIFALWREWSKTAQAFSVRSSHLFVLAGGALLSLIGILAFGLYVSPRLNEGDQGFRFSALSFVLGLLAAGSYILDAPRAPLILRSVGFTSPNLTTSLRNEADMDAGVTIWRSLFTGIFVMGIPAAVVASSAGLKSTGIGVGVVQLLVVGAVGAVWYMFDENIRALDGKIMSRVDLTFPKGLRSYFEFDD
ncbi:hypothetical protein N0V93_010181 [Gnomoniopsis smithogilvyi]|uniref:Major facilitator superfamily (MFS) profile domain-containing protein n=1 Tax=Gnomoniopsis smithogilvyi TaxID=1191159 RepID=A0A9W9CT21_9PEZI|nr:hypothetical protein N0V93_010181 [Gnomoniopsis smithogilvyi]